jgi:hypothetical protein
MIRISFVYKVACPATTGRGSSLEILRQSFGLAAARNLIFHLYVKYKNDLSSSALCCYSSHKLFATQPVDCDVNKKSKDSQAQNGHFCVLIDKHRTKNLELLRNGFLSGK